jgi:hypothetical protein
VFVCVCVSVCVCVCVCFCFCVCLCGLFALVSSGPSSNSALVQGLVRQAVVLPVAVLSAFAVAAILTSHRSIEDLYVSHQTILVRSER